MTIDRNGLTTGRRVTLVGVAVNAALIGLKILGGILGRSQALIADAVHSVSDLFTDLVVLWGLKAGRKAADDDHHFGHARIETLASTVVGFSLIGAAVYLGIEAGLSIYDHTPSSPSWLAVVAAAFSVLSKEVLYRYTVKVGRRIRSPVVEANAWHHRSDALSSVAVLIGLAAIQFNPDWHILDAVAALVVSFLVLKVGALVLWNSIREFTDTAPKPEVLDKIGACARSVAGVIEIHDLRVRMSGGVYQMELHVVVDGGLTVRQGHCIAKEVEKCVLDDVAEAGHVIVHVDPHL